MPSPSRPLAAPRARRLSALSALLALFGWAGCRGTAAPLDGGFEPVPPSGPYERTPVSDGIVTADDEGRFVQDGEPFVPEGIGSYPLLEHAGNGRLSFLEDVFEQAHDLGRPILRTNAFFDGGDSPARVRNDDGSLNPGGLRGLDLLLETAARHDVRLILVLTNNWEDYGGADAVVQIVAPSLPKDAFWSEQSIVQAQLDYVATLVGRTNVLNGRAYRNDPTIFAWELGNEPRCTDPSWCGRGTLERWAAEMVDVIRDAGAEQLVAWGGSGHEGRYGESLSRIARTSGVDVLTLHLYPFHMDESLLGIRDFASRVEAGVIAGSERIREAAELSEHHALPLLIEELGWLPQPGAEADRERALVMTGWLDEASRYGVGTLPWMIAESGRADYDGLLIRPSVDGLTSRAIRYP